MKSDRTSAFALRMLSNRSLSDNSAPIGRSRNNSQEKNQSAINICEPEVKVSSKKKKQKKKQLNE